MHWTTALGTPASPAGCDQSGKRKQDGWYVFEMRIEQFGAEGVDALQRRERERKRGSGWRGSPSRKKLQPSGAVDVHTSEDRRQPYLGVQTLARAMLPRGKPCPGPSNAPKPRICLASGRYSVTHSREKPKLVRITRWNSIMEPNIVANRPSSEIEADNHGK
jgi:hypothetical protein